MEEKCFIVKDKKICEQYFKWWNNRENLAERWKQFKKMVGIEAEVFVPNKTLYIVPTENDINNFGKLFCKEVFQKDLRKFKANSKIQKEWEKFIKTYEVLVERPNIAFHFLGTYIWSGRITTKIFHYKDTVYCSASAEKFNEDKLPDGFKEIKKSEFYKIMEKVEEETNDKQ